MHLKEIIQMEIYFIEDAIKNGSKIIISDKFKKKWMEK